MTKLLEKGSFFWPKAAQSGQGGRKLAPEAFALLTDGIDMHGARPRGWYLRDVFTRLPGMTNQKIDEVMSDAWAKAKARSAGHRSSDQRVAAQSQATA